MAMPSIPERRNIPSVDLLLRQDGLRPLIAAHGRSLVTAVVREVLDQLRRPGAEGGHPQGSRASSHDIADLLSQVQREVVLRARASVCRVINATGVVVHTNLGRAPLSEPARAAMEFASSRYTTLEYDLAQGERGSRSSRLEQRVATLFPGRAALAVNNNASAVFLALRALCQGREAVLSRGELVEIGGSFRVPDMMAESGARLREVGTTNRTRLSDYEKAMGDGTGLILKVHPSNYRIVGFTSEASIPELAALGRQRGVPLVVDQGSGYLRPLPATGLRDEPTVQEVLSQGADLVTFSGDKLLGGPQAGVAVGRPGLIEAMRRCPMYRVLRLDKTTLAALEATLDAYLRGVEQEEIPVLRMLAASPGELAARAASLARRLAKRLASTARVEVEEGASRAGGGSGPAEDLPTTLVSLRPARAGGEGVTAWEVSLRGAAVPVIARVRDDALWLDPRTVDPSEEEDLIESVATALSPAGGEG